MGLTILRFVYVVAFEVVCGAIFIDEFMELAGMKKDFCCFYGVLISLAAGE